MSLFTSFILKYICLSTTMLISMHLMQRVYMVSLYGTKGISRGSELKPHNIAITFQFLVINSTVEFISSH